MTKAKTNPTKIAKATALLSKLETWEGNYNVGDVEAIAASVRAFGFNGGLVVWQDGLVLAGNHTLAALRMLHAQGAADGAPWPPEHIEDKGGDWLVPIIDISHLDWDEARAFAVAHNRTRDLAETDKEALLSLLDGIAEADAGLVTATGYDEAALNVLSIEVRPKFEPVSPEEQDRLDKRKEITCPECGGTFEP